MRPRKHVELFMRGYIANGPNRVHLICTSCESVIASSGETNARTEWFLEFSPSGLAQTWSLSPNNFVHAANEWDAIMLGALFLPHDTEILGGWVTLTVNSIIKRKFDIPPQKTKSIGENFVLPVTVVSW
jgi:hypothetical protein